jgi:hypothetical protein
LNEYWTEGAHYDYKNCAWIQVLQEQWMANPAGDQDNLSQCQPSAPHSLAPQDGNVSVYYWAGEHYAGSSTTAAGTLVLQNTWHYYQDHATRK